MTDALVEAIGAGKYDFIVANYANPDMVGHTGVWDAAVRAVEFLDGCIGRVADACASGGCAAVHHRGPRQRRRDARRRRQPADRAFAQPGAGRADRRRSVRGRRLRDGVLADVAPTLLELVGVPPGEGMTGQSLLVRDPV